MTQPTATLMGSELVLTIPCKNSVHFYGIGWEEGLLLSAQIDALVKARAKTEDELAARRRAIRESRELRDLPQQMQKKASKKKTTKRR